jgi:hypothetical protein
MSLLWELEPKWQQRPLGKSQAATASSAHQPTLGKARPDCYFGMLHMPAQQSEAFGFPKTSLRVSHTIWVMTFFRAVGKDVTWGKLSPSPWHWSQLSDQHPNLTTTGSRPSHLNPDPPL